jgi:undecaprenyl diphosphate synthase
LPAPARAPESAGAGGDINEATSTAFALSFAPDPDLLIRTGGERRISNFLPAAGLFELHFSDALWPDFDAAEPIARWRGTPRGSAGSA